MWHKHCELLTLDADYVPFPFPPVTLSMHVTSHLHFVNSHLVNVNKVGIDKVGIDEVGIDEVGIDKVGRCQMIMLPTMYS